MAAVGRIGRALRRAAPGKKAAPAAKRAAAKKSPAKKTAPAKKSPAKKSPAKKTSARSAAPANRAATKKAPAKKAAVKKAPAKKAPAKKAPVKKAPAKKAPAKKAPAKKAPAKKAPVKKAPAKKAPAKKTPAKKTPAKAVAQKAPVATKAAPPVRTAPAPKPKPSGNGVAVPAGSEWTKAELAAVRKQLADELAALRSAYDDSLRDLDDLQRAGTDGAGDDQADAGSKTFEREQEQSIAANRRDLITQIQHAIERIEAGTYGFCESCGKPIPKARLKAFPAATLDVVCKQREERR